MRTLMFHSICSHVYPSLVVFMYLLSLQINGLRQAQGRFKGRGQEDNVSPEAAEHKARTRLVRTGSK